MNQTILFVKLIIVNGSFVVSGCYELQILDK